MKTFLKIFAASLVVWGIASAGFVYYNWDNIDYTQRCLSRAVHHIEMPFDQIHAGTTRQQIRAQLTKPGLICFKEDSSLGDMACSAHIKSVDGVPAMHVSYYFIHEKINMAKIDLLNWHHDKAYQMLVKRYGKPFYWQPSKIEKNPLFNINIETKLIKKALQLAEEDRLIIWQSPTGYIFYNLKRPINPAQWNTILFRPDRGKRL